jgi:hypothetical protein
VLLYEVVAARGLADGAVVQRLIPLATPITAATVTNVGRSAIARHGRRALHLPMLATERNASSLRR